MADDGTRDLATVMEPFRGKRREFIQRLGRDEGYRLLWAYCAGSPTEAAEFTGLNHKTISEAWARLGLPIMKRDPHDETRATREWTDDDWFAFWERMTSGVETAVKWSWRLPEGAEFGRLHFIGDIHFGNVHQDSRKLMEFVEWLKGQPHDRWVLMGDLFELRGRSSKGEPPLFDQDVAMMLAKRVLGPIMPQCALCHSGNHDRRIIVQEDIAFDPVRDFAREFGVPYNGMEGFNIATLTDGHRRQKYTGYCHHGYGGARTPGARTNQLIQLLSGTNADFLVMAHLHDKQAGGKAEFGPDGTSGIVSHWARPVARCGSFLKHEQGSYTRVAGMPPGIPGAATLLLHLDKHDVHERQ